MSNKALVQKYHHEMALRKKLHNQVVELKGNIRVLCRVRPPITEDGTGANSRIVVAPDEDDDSLIKVLWKGQTKFIEVDRVFGKLSTQEQVDQSSCYFINHVVYRCLMRFVALSRHAWMGTMFVYLPMAKLALGRRIQWR